MIEFTKGNQPSMKPSSRAPAATENRKKVPAYGKGPLAMDALYQRTARGPRFPQLMIDEVRARFVKA